MLIAKHSKSFDFLGIKLYPAVFEDNFHVFGIVNIERNTFVNKYSVHIPTH